MRIESVEILLKTEEEESYREDGKKDESIDERKEEKELGIDVDVT